MTSTGSGSRCSGSASIRSGDGRVEPERAQRGPEPVRAQPRGMQPARQLAQLARRRAVACSRARAISRAASSGERSAVRSARSRHWPSTTSRCCAPSCRSRPIRRRSSSAACRSRVRDAVTSASRSAQRGLVAAALQLGRGARGEDPQDGELLLAGVEPRAREHADVADVAPVGAVHRHGEVAVEPVADEEPVAREAGHRAGRVADDVARGRSARTACRRARTRSPRAAARRPASRRGSARASAGSASSSSAT